MAQGMHGSIGVKGEFVAAVFEAFDFGHGAGFLVGDREGRPYGAGTDDREGRPC